MPTIAMTAMPGNPIGHKPSARPFAKMASTLLFLACLIPYISPVPIAGDVQPIAIGIATLIFSQVFLFHRLPSSYWLLAFPTLIALILLLDSKGGGVIEMFRTLTFYLSPMIFTGALLYVLRNVPINLSAITSAALLIWTAGGFFQITFGLEIFSFLLTDVRSSYTRGVTSFSNEPSFFGLTMILIFILCLVQRDLKPWKVGLIGFNIVYVAQSSVAIMICAAMAVAYMLSNSKAFAISALLAIIFFTQMETITQLLLGQLAGIDSRVAGLARAVLENPGQVLARDASVASRFIAIAAPVYTFVTDLGMPHGYSIRAWHTAIGEMKDVAPELFHAYYLTGGIDSGYGKALFQIGFPALVYPILFAVWIFQMDRLPLRSRVVAIVGFTAIMMNAITLANPLPFVILAYALHSRHDEAARAADRVSRTRSPTNSRLIAPA
ncbi:MAG: hypothetical protein WA979_01705 [Pacificimonas sp.]